MVAAGAAALCVRETRMGEEGARAHITTYLTREVRTPGGPKLSVPGVQYLALGRVWSVLCFFVKAETVCGAFHGARATGWGIVIGHRCS